LTLGSSRVFAMQLFSVDIEWNEVVPVHPTAEVAVREEQIPRYARDDKSRIVMTCTPAQSQERRAKSR
jgi:hypothetical protein